MNNDSESTKPDGQQGKALSGRDAYNLVSDTVTGVNVRLKDNLIQGIAILVCLVLGAAIGAAVAEPPIAGALAGGLLGLVVGAFLSGFALMIYRGIMHLRGRHD